MSKKQEIQKVEALRKRAKVTQEVIAEALHITGHTWRNWIKGRSEPTFSIRQIKTLCEIFECELDELPDDFTELAE
ncbi:MAG: helix-turn-helix transcriptional regulator [Cyanobacteria bacterium J06648_10]